MGRSCRFAAGKRNGPKSSIWTLTVSKSDIYLSTRLFGSSFKLSLHDSGDAQWSLTSEFVSRQTDMPNKDRHFLKWHFDRPSGDSAINIFRIQIPHTELRDIPSPTNKTVKWTSGITLGTYQFDLHLTRPSEINPVEGRTDLPYKVFDSLQLEDQRWLVIFIHAVGLNPEDIEKARQQAISEMKKKNLPIDKADRIGFFGKGDDGVPFIMELFNDHLVNGK